MNAEEQFAAYFLSYSVFLQLGFEFANKSTLPSKLRAIKPLGMTAMRDAILEGSSLMRELGNII